MTAAYDFIIVGGGPAGLGLACQLARGRLRERSILIVERHPAGGDRTWSYWTQAPTVFDAAVTRRWSRLRAAGPGFSRTVGLPGYRYEMIHSRDLQRVARQMLAARPNVTFYDGAAGASVESITDGDSHARVVVDGEPIEAEWVFDGRGPRGPARGGLRMAFDGWTIETEAPVFSPDTVTFFDLRTPQPTGLRFFYVMPLSECRALVQLVSVSPHGLGAAEAEQAVRAYLADTLGVESYQADEREAGWMPVNLALARRRLGRRVMAIGARAGLIKPSTGFGFRRIQDDAAAIAGSLARTGRPWRVPAVIERHRWYDALLLDVLAHEAEAVPPIFRRMFAANPIERVLRFLDEATTPAEELALIATLPRGPFLAAMMRRT